MDSNELYEQNIIPFKEYFLEVNTMEIDDKFYENMPLNDIKNVKFILKEIKKIKTNSLNYDFIKNKDLIDTYINNTNFLNIEDKYINEEESIEIHDDSNDEIIKEADKKNKKNNNNIKITEKEERDSNIEEEHDKLLIDSNFIEYRKKYSFNKSVWWPINLSYAEKKYYPATHSSYLKKNYYSIEIFLCKP